MKYEICKQNIWCDVNIFTVCQYNDELFHAWFWSGFLILFLFSKYFSGQIFFVSFSFYSGHQLRSARNNKNNIVQELKINNQIFDVILLSKHSPRWIFTCHFWSTKKSKVKKPQKFKRGESNWQCLEHVWH